MDSLAFLYNILTPYLFFEQSICVIKTPHGVYLRAINNIIGKISSLVRMALRREKPRSIPRKVELDQIIFIIKVFG